MSLKPNPQIKLVIKIKQSIFELDNKEKYFELEFLNKLK